MGSFNTISGTGSSDKVSTAILNQIHVDGVFVKTTPMGTAPNVVYRVGDGTVHPEGWDNVLDNEYLDFYISYTSDADFADISLVGTNILDVITVADNIASVNTVSADITSVVSVAGDIVALVSLYGDKIVLDSLYADKATLDSLYADKTKLDSLSADKTVLDSLYADKATLDSLFADKVSFDSIYANMAEILLADDNASAAAVSATQAQLHEWEAEAERLTADSYATEAEDTFVNLVTSDGDGTFTYTPTTEYSALHWAAKAATFNPANYYTKTESNTLFEPADADIAKTDVTQTFTLPQRAAVTTDNDLSFDLAATNNFKCTPTATGQLTFTNLADGQGGRIVLDNSGGYVITKNALVLASSTFLNTISTAGKYLIGYECDGVNVFINSTEALV